MARQKKANDDARTASQDPIRRSGKKGLAKTTTTTDTPSTPAAEKQSSKRKGKQVESDTEKPKKRSKKNPRPKKVTAPAESNSEESEPDPKAGGKEDFAIKHNWPGVYLIESNIHSNDAQLVQYLEFKDSNQLRDWLWDGGKNEELLSAYVKSKGKKFGVMMGTNVNKTKRWNPAKIWEHVTLHSDEWQQFDQVPLNMDSRQEIRGYYTICVTLYKLLQQNQETFTGSQRVDHERILGFVPEDWNRAWAVLRYVAVGERILKSSGSVETDKKGKHKQNKGGAKLKWLTAASREKKGAVGSSSLVNNEERLSLRARDSAVVIHPEVAEDLNNTETQTGWKRYYALSRGQSNWLTINTAFDGFMTKAQQQTEKLRPNQLEKLPDRRAQLTPAQQVDLLREIGKQANILYPAIDAEHPLVPTTETVDAQARAFFAALEAKRAGVAASSAEPVSLDSEREEHWKFMSGLNKYGAKPTGYIDACKWLRLDPEKPVIPGYIPVGTEKEAEHVLTAYQVLGLWWMRNMELSAAQGCILADEMGLGKTIMALSTVAQDAMEHGAKLTLPTVTVSSLTNNDDDTLSKGETTNPDSDSDQETNDEKPPLNKTRQPTGAQPPYEPFARPESPGDSIAVQAPGAPSSSAMTQPTALAQFDGSTDQPELGLPPQQPQAGPAGDSSTANNKDDVGKRDLDAPRPSPSTNLSGLSTLSSLSGPDKVARINAVLKPLLEQIRGRKYKQTLVVCPSNALNVWASERSKHFKGMRMKKFHGAPNRVDMYEREDTIEPHVIGLVKHMASVPDEPEALAETVLTSYSTWVKRTLYEDESGDATKSPKTKQKTAAGAEDDNLEDNDHMAEISEEKWVMSKSYIGPGCFRRIIYDESQLIKDIFTLASKSLGDLEADFRVLMTATPMMNKPKDFAGLLYQLHRQVWMARDDYKVDASLSDYGESFERIEEMQDSEDPRLLINNLGAYLWLLNPSIYKYLTKTPRAESNVDPAKILEMLPPILSCFQLRRTMATKVEGIPGQAPLRIGDSIPPSYWTTIELQYPHRDIVDYAAVHSLCASSLSAGEDEEGEPRRNMVNHRRLCLNTTNIHNDRILYAANHGVADLETISAKYRDQGASYYFKHTRYDDRHGIPRDRVTMAHWLSAWSPKFQCLVRIIYDVVFEGKRNLLVFNDWPLHQWELEMLLDNLGVEYVSIRAVHKAEDRQRAIREFNTSGPLVLLTSLRTSSTALNLQEGGSDIVFLDMGGNLNTMLQAAGRVIRLKQKRPVYVWLLTVDHTYDQAMQGKAIRKFIGVMAAQADIQVDPQSIEARMQVPDDKGILATPEEARRLVIETICSRSIQRLFGQRSPRHQWDDVRDLTLKDGLPVEKKFRKEFGLPSDLFLKPRSDSARKLGKYNAIMSEIEDKTTTPTKPPAKVGKPIKGHVDVNNDDDVFDGLVSPLGSLFDEPAVPDEPDLRNPEAEYTPTDLPASQGSVLPARTPKPKIRGPAQGTKSDKSLGEYRDKPKDTSIWTGTARSAEQRKAAQPNSGLQLNESGKSQAEASNVNQTQRTTAPQRKRKADIPASEEGSEQEPLSKLVTPKLPPRTTRSSKTPKG